MSSIESYWSLGGALFYIFLGVVAMFAMMYAKKSEVATGSIPSWKNKYLVAWWFIWVFFAVFRIVNMNTGGADAPTYIYYFENCNGSVLTSWFEHVGSDIGFKWLNKICRYLCSDYHFYFLVIYGFMAYAYMLFLNRFCSAKTSFVPYLLSFFLFLRAFVTFRTNLAIAFIAVACVFLIEKKWQWAYLIGIIAVLFHKSAVIYVACIPFCHFFANRKISIKAAVLFVILSSLIGRVLQAWFIQYASSTDLNGAYVAYASHSVGVSFWQNAWKTAFEQMLLAVVMLVMHKRIGLGHSEQERSKFDIVWNLCIYDFMLIPINFIIGSWRGYEFFYLARIIMWGECLYQVLHFVKRDYRLIISASFFIVFVAWMLFRISATWADSRLLPYVFEPFLLLF